MSQHAPIEVAAAVMRERAYQERKRPSRRQSVPGYLLIMAYELIVEAIGGWIKGNGDEDALREVLQVVAVGFACLEEHGIVEREECRR